MASFYGNSNNMKEKQFNIWDFRGQRILYKVHNQSERINTIFMLILQSIWKLNIHN